MLHNPNYYAKVITIKAPLFKKNVLTSYYRQFITGHSQAYILISAAATQACTGELCIDLWIHTIMSCNEAVS